MAANIGFSFDFIFRKQLKHDKNENNKNTNLNVELIEFTIDSILYGSYIFTF